MSRKRPTAPANLHYRTAEIRADNEGAGLSGYASHFGSIDSYGTAVKKGAFTRTLQQRGDRIPVLWNHWPDSPIGKPVELREDDTGLWFSASISEGTTHGRDVMALLRDGVPLGMSFGFETLKSRPLEDGDTVDWSQAPDFYKDPNQGREYVRIIEEVRLWEISVVTFPANEMATINDVRQAAQLDALATLLEDLRTGPLPDGDGRLALLHQIDALRATADPDPAHATPLSVDATARRRNLDAELKLLTFTVGTGD